MSLFTKKQTITIMSEQQKDAYLEKLENTHVNYDIYENRVSFYSDSVSYIIRIKAADLKKVS